MHVKDADIRRFALLWFFHKVSGKLDPIARHFVNKRDLSYKRYTLPFGNLGIIFTKGRVTRLRDANAITRWNEVSRVTS